MNSPIILDKGRFSSKLQRFQNAQLGLLERWLSPVVGGRLLDAGCGSGILTRCLPFGADWYGVDISPAGEEFHGKFYQVDLTDIPFEDRYFDAAVCIDVLEHVERVQVGPILDELARVTRQSLIVCVPNEPPLPSLRVHCPHCAVTHHPSFHLQNVRPDDLIQQMAGNGFRLKEHKQVGDLVLLGHSIARLIFHKHFWEYQFYWKLPCFQCGRAPCDYYRGVDSEAMIACLYQKLAQHWFDALPESTIEWSENALLFERDLSECSGYMPFDVRHYVKPEPMVPELRIRADRASALKISPYTLPMSSYIVLKEDLLNRHQALGGPNLLLPPGNYPCFFTSRIERIRIKASATAPVEAYFYWVDDHKVRHDALLVITGDTQEYSIHTTPSPALGIEGAYINMYIKTYDQPGSVNYDSNLVVEVLEAIPPVGPSPKSDAEAARLCDLAKEFEDYLSTYRRHIALNQNSVVRSQHESEELNLWTQLSEELFMEHLAISEGRQSQASLLAQIESSVTAQAETAAELQRVRGELEATKELLTQHQASLHQLRYNFMWACSSPRFTAKQCIKLILNRLGLRPFPPLPRVLQS